MAGGKSGPGGAICAGCAKAAPTFAFFAGTRREWGGAAPFSASRRACQTALEGQTAPQTPFLRDTPKSGAPTLKRLRPAGANSVEYAHPQRPLPPRGKAASFPPPARQSRPLPPLRPKRTATRPPPAHGVGARLCEAKNAGNRPSRRIVSRRLMPCALHRPRPRKKALAPGKSGPWPRWMPPLETWKRGWAVGPQEQGIAAPALKTLVWRLRFPLCAVLLVFPMDKHAMEAQPHSRLFARGKAGQAGE